MNQDSLLVEIKNQAVKRGCWVTYTAGAIKLPNKQKMNFCNDIL